MKYLKLRLLPLCALLIALGAASSYGAEITFACSLENGFVFTSDTQGTVGYITALTIGTTTLTADLAVKDPVAGAGIKAVAVLSNFSWGGNVSDPFKFEGCVSTANKQKIATLLSQHPSNAPAQFGFKIFQYDAAAKKYFVALSSVSDAVLKGITLKTTDQMTIETKPDGTVASPQNFAMKMEVAPQAGISQSIKYAPASSSSVIKKWGQ
jgi:hypothetical protein